MLKALYDYSIRNGLTLPPGFLKKSIRAYILLSGSGDLLGIELCDSEVLICPDIGPTNGKYKCNPLAEKTAIVLFTPDKDHESNAKTQFFIEMLQSACEVEPRLKPCLTLLQTPDLLLAAKEEAALKKLKNIDRISFKVDGIPIVSYDSLTVWWSEYRKQFAKGTGQTLCLITGEPTTPLSTVPPVNGLQSVGGQASGTPLICFDKPAFCSYGLSKSTNAPVSEEAFAAVNAALSDLLSDAPALYQHEKGHRFSAAPVFSGMKFIHWYDNETPIAPEEDPILSDFSGFGLVDAADDGDEEEEPPDPQQIIAQAASDAKKAADELVKSVQTGVKKPPLANHYYILLLSGAGGRVMVRRFEQGSYGSLQKHLSLWNSDLELCNDIGTGILRPCKLTARLARLLGRRKNDAKVFDRLNAELSGLTSSIVMSILHGTPLPDAVASRALSYIRAQMISSDEKDADRKNFDRPLLPDGICCQWLKVWLLRKKRAQNEEVALMPYYDPSFPSAAYHCGALVAIYADLQRRAMSSVNAGVVERYYASASRTPTLVLGQLERLSKFHLAKLESRYLAQLYEDRLNEVYSFFGADGLSKLPTALTLEEQTCFALGYRQMCAHLTAERREAAQKPSAERKENA